MKRIALVVLIIALGVAHGALAEVKEVSLDPSFIENVNAGLAYAQLPHRIKHYVIRIHTALYGETSAVEASVVMACSPERTVASNFVYAPGSHDLSLQAEGSLQKEGFRLASLKEAKGLGAEETIKSEWGRIILGLAFNPCRDPTAFPAAHQHFLISVWVDGTSYLLVARPLTEERFQQLAR